MRRFRKRGGASSEYDDEGFIEEDEFSFPFFANPASLAEQGAMAASGGEIRNLMKTRRVKGAEAAEAAGAAKAKEAGAAKKAGGGGKGGKGAADAARAEAAGGAKGKGGKGGKGGKDAKGGKGRKRRRGKGKRGKGAAGEGDYDYLGEGDADNQSFPVKVIDRMQDIHLVGGQFIESIGKSIEEVSPNPLVDNVTLLDAADGIVLIVFLIIFMMVFGVINYYFQRVMFYFLRKWIMRMDPHEAFEWPTPDCTDEGVPVFHKVLFFPDDDDRFAATVGEAPKNVDVKKTQVYRVLLKSIQKAKSSVMCCLFVVTCREMADLLIYARKERKISVYILTDEEMARLPTSLMGELSDAGVSIKVMRSNVMLHHHFVIVDSRVLFNGSFNWTRQAVGFNFETMFITNDPALVLPYRNHLSRLGSLAQPMNHEPEPPFTIGDDPNRPACADFDPRYGILR